MLLTRRTFVQSSLVDSLALAAEATRTRWLLNSSDCICDGLAGLSASASQHLAHYAAIPGVHIAHIEDGSIHLVSQALAQLKDLGQPGPSISTTLDALLADRSLHAVSLPSEIPASGFTLSRILTAGLPVLTDLPPSSFTLTKHRTVPDPRIHLRVADLMYPGVALDLHSWSNRSDIPEIRTEIRADLTLERRLSPAEIRAVLISALQVLLISHPLTNSQLSHWSKTSGVIELAQASTAAIIHLPERISGPRSLNVSLLPRSFAASILSLRHHTGSIELPIWRDPDAQTSLRTVMHFLNSVRTGAASLPQPDPAFAACSVVDGLLRSLHRAR